MLLKLLMDSGLQFTTSLTQRLSTCGAGHKRNRQEPTHQEKDCARRLRHRRAAKRRAAAGWITKAGPPCVVAPRIAAKTGRVLAPRYIIGGIDLAVAVVIAGQDCITAVHF